MSSEASELVRSIVRTLACRMYEWAKPGPTLDGPKTPEQAGPLAWPCVLIGGPYDGLHDTGIGVDPEKALQILEERYEYAGKAPSGEYTYQWVRGDT